MTTPEFVFQGYDSSYGNELWITDGTASGTHLLKDIVPGVNSSSPFGFYTLPGGEVLFGVADTSGVELWVTNGTASGTSEIAAIDPGIAISRLVALGASGRSVFEVKPDPTTGYQLWVTDGTNTGTHVLDDTNLNHGTYSHAPYSITQLTPLGSGGTDALFIGSYHKGSGPYTTLFVTDGTSGGTKPLLPAFQAGTSPYNIKNLVAGSSEDFFLAQTYGVTNSSNSYELWVSDGTTAGTHAITTPASLKINPTQNLAGGPQTFDHGVVFDATDGTHGYQLWYSDGTAGGARMISNNPLFNLSAGSAPAYFSTFKNQAGTPLALFDARGGTGNIVKNGNTYAYAPYDVFVTNGTASGTTQLTTIHAPQGSTNGEPSNFTPIGHKVVFTAAGSSYSADPAYSTIGTELWVTDGTTSGTYLLKDINPGPGPSYASNLKSFGNEVLFTANDGSDGTQLWVTDGTKSGTHMITSNYPNNFTFSSGAPIGPTPCYVQGTRVLTPLGEVAVEDLIAGDLLTTLDGASKPIRWIGKRRVTAGEDARDRTSLPVRIAQDALGYGVPHRDLLVSPDHALYLDGVLVPAQYLVNGRNITRCLDLETAEYFHIELPRHDIILAEGVAAETYLDTGNRAMFENGAGTAADEAAVPDDTTTTAPAARCAPFVEGGPRLNAIRWAINIRAETKGFGTTRDPDLHLLADGAVIRAETVEDGRYRFRLDTRPSQLRIRSRAEIPACCSGTGDWRRLGVAIKRMALSDEAIATEIGSAAACLSEGFSYIESGFRWTDGDADVPAALCLPFAGSFYIEIQIVDTLDYPLPAAAGDGRMASYAGLDALPAAVVSADLAWQQSAGGAATVH